MPNCSRAGTSVHYEIGGRGPHLLLLNGLVASAYLWPSAWLARFEAHYTVVRVSNRGTGHTLLGDGLTIDAMARDALAVLDASGADRAAVLGFSMGGMVAQALTLAAPARVTALVLCSTTTGGANDAHPEFLAALTGAGGDAVKASSSFLHLLTGPGFWDDNPTAVAELAVAWQQAPTPAETALAQLGAAAGFDGRTAIGSIRVPTLVLHGSEDRLIVPAGGRRLAGGIPGATFHLYEGVGHMLPFEATDQAGDAIAAFLGNPPS